MKSIDVIELKKIQLDILDTVHEFCVEHNIKYSMACGTMLGAIRHKGYIPWDDDIDIYLLREEYNKLLTMFPEELNNIKLASLSRDKKWGRAYAKAYDRRTLICDAGNPYMIGVGIDVFPIDTVPANELEWNKYDSRRRKFQRIYELKVSMWFRKGRSLWKYFFIPLNKLILLPFSVRTLGMFLDRYSQKYNKETNSSYVFECCQGILIKRPFKRSTLEEVVETPFEDRIFMGMKNYDDYLKNAYGNYMQLPPKEKQVTHHIQKAWWKDC